MKQRRREFFLGTLKVPMRRRTIPFPNPLVKVNGLLSFMQVLLVMSFVTRNLMCCGGELLGNETGFVTGALFTKSTKVKTDEYNFNMDFTSFKNWFQILLGCLQGSCIICFDNAPFHNQNYLPKSNAKKQELLDFLNALGHQVTEDFSKSELAEMIRPYRKGNREEVIDHMARRRGHVPLRIPPYHCDFNVLVQNGLHLIICICDCRSFQSHRGGVEGYENRSTCTEQHIQSGESHRTY